MFCAKCGKELMQNARFCNYCGAPLEGIQTTQAPPAREKKGKKKLLIWLASIVTVVAVAGMVLYFALSSPSLRLKYDWGTSDETIIDNETVLDTHEYYWSDQEFYIQCENPYGRIGNLEGYSCDYVNYYFYDGKLCQIFASFNERYTSWEEYIEQIEKTLGKEHYDNWIIKNRYVWWIDDTIIEFDVRNRLICFSDQDYFQECYGDSKDYQEMAAFFGK